MGRFTNWLLETLGTVHGRSAAGAAASNMESLEPRLLLSGNTAQGSPGLNITPIPGDANCDGAVDVVDLGVLARNYGTAATGYSYGDFNNDGRVDVIDLGILAKNYDTTLGNYGDANDDGTVDVVDLGILARNYGAAATGAANADFNNDGKVDVIDLGILAANYGRVLAPPLITVNALTTALASPALTGTVRAPDTTVSVAVGGKTYTAVNNYDGTWTLPAGSIDPLAAGEYSVMVTATDAAGNTSTASTTLVHATSYQDLVGTPPNPATAAFSDWCNDLLAARESQIPAPTATYYFAAGGDDSTGDGSMAHPWQSIAKANTMLESDGVQCLFNRGDEWPSSVGLVLAGNNTSVGCYGDTSKPKPLIDCFTHTIPTSAAWTQVNGTNDYTYAVNTGSPSIVITGTGTIGGVSADGMYTPVGTCNGQITYHNSANNFWIWFSAWGNLWLLTDAAPGGSLANYWCSVAGAAGFYSTFSAAGTADNGISGVGSVWFTPAWIRDQARRFDAYAWMGTTTAMTSGPGQADAIAAAITLVENTPYSWFYDPTTYLLHVNAGGASPATISWEFSDTVAVFNTGVNIEQSGYVFGIRVDGWGCGPALGGYIGAEWGITFTGGVGAHAVVEDCEAYYDGRHNIGSTGTGYNAFTVIDCQTGYTNNTDGAGTGDYVGYSTDGSNETVFWDCAVRFGEVPWSGGPLSGWTGSSSVNLHAGGTVVYDVGLALVWGMKVTGEPGWHNATWGDGCIAFASESLPGDNSDITTLRAWVVGCSYDVPSAPSCGNNVSNKAVSINCSQKLTLTAAGAAVATPYICGNAGWSINESIDITDLDGGPSGNRYLWMTGVTINQSVRITCANPAESVTIGDFGTGTGTLVNCEFSVVGAAATSAIIIPTANCSHDAYSGLTDWRSGVEPGEIGLLSPIDPLAIPYPGSALYDAGCSAVAVLGTALEYDINWNRRPADTPSIGAVEGEGG